MTYHSSEKIRLCFTALLLVVATCIVIPASAQLRFYPIERSPSPLHPVKTKTSSTGRIQAALTLPFFDDFSATHVYNPLIPGSGYPDQDLWYNSGNVWINEGIGIKAPSVNVASFDGVDSLGRVYSTSSLENGFRDTLVSNVIDLSTSAVTLAERPGVYLSFFYQWQGNGEAPDLNDFLQLQFLDADSVWTTVATKYGSAEIENTVFTYVTVQLLEDKFFHDNFRFRFRNYGNKSGPYDTWNIDYVYLDKGRSAGDPGFPDRAVASGLTPIFGRYRSMPLNHFRLARVVDPAKVEIQNLRGGAEGSPTDIYLQQSFLNYIDGSLTRIEKPFGPIGSKYPNNFLLPGERVTSTLKTDVNPIDVNDPSFGSYFLPEADSIELRIRLDLYEPDAGLYRANDTLTATYKLKDYYAYDDGTAEYFAVLNQSDDQVAIGFDLPTDEAQELVGFDIYIPRYGLNGYTTTSFFVMDSENGEPNQKLTGVTHVVQDKGRDAFQTVSFDPVLVRNRFFVGWRGSSGNQLKVGIDQSNNTTDLIYEDLNGVMENGKIKWYAAASLSEGTIMIRPNFGTASTNTGIITNKERINFYPNPSNGSFFIQGLVRNLSIYSATGQKIPFTQQNDGERTLISLGDLQPGIYVMRMIKGNNTLTEKIVVTR